MRGDDSTKRGVEHEFRLALQALALPPDRQVELHRGACVACELLSEFRHWATCYADNYFAGEVTPEQRRWISEVGARLDEVADSDEYQCWVDGPVRTGWRWETARQAARQALRSFGWPEIPPAQL